VRGGSWRHVNLNGKKLEALGTAKTNLQPPENRRTDSHGMWSTVFPTRCDRLPTFVSAPAASRGRSFCAYAPSWVPNYS
jgi:hypothetical protein